MKENRAPLLDIYRIILCVGVIVYHFTPDRPSSGPFMVLGFFVMSGFLLGIYFEKITHFHVEKFYKKKGQRLLPMFVTALILGVLFKATGTVFSDNLSLLPQFSTIEWTNFNPARFIAHYNTPLWFMIVELSMLICAPLLFVLYNKKSGIGVLLILAVSVSVFLYSRLPETPAPFAENLYYLTLYRAYQFIAGLYTAKLFCLILKSYKNKTDHIPAEKVLTWILFICFIIVSIYFMICKQGSDLHYFNYSITFDILCVIFYCILIPLLYIYPITFKRTVTTCLGYIAALTYPLYLLHVIIYKPIERLLGTEPVWIPGISAFVVSLGASIVLLYLQNRYFSQKKQQNTYSS